MHAAGAHHREIRDPFPWAEDSILRAYKFCNVYRATDRVSQYLIRDVTVLRECPPPGVEAQIDYGGVVMWLFNFERALLCFSLAAGVIAGCSATVLDGGSWLGL